MSACCLPMLVEHGENQAEFGCRRMKITTQTHVPPSLFSSTVGVRSGRLSRDRRGGEYWFVFVGYVDAASPALPKSGARSNYWVLGFWGSCTSGPSPAQGPNLLGRASIATDGVAKSGCHEKGPPRAAPFLTLIALSTSSGRKQVRRNRGPAPFRYSESAHQTAQRGQHVLQIRPTTGMFDM